MKITPQMAQLLHDNQEIQEFAADIGWNSVAASIERNELPLPPEVVTALNPKESYGESKILTPTGTDTGTGGGVGEEE